MKVQFFTLFDPRTRTDGQGQNHEKAYPEADLEGGVRGVRPPPLKFAKHMLYNVN